jgi:hypothetical protein
LPAGVVEGSGDLAGWSATERHAEDEFDRGLAVGVDDHPLLDVAVVVDRDGELVAVGLVADELAAGGRSPAAGGHGEALAAGVLVVALSGDDGVEQVTERVGVLHGAHADVVLECPEGDLDGMTG